MSVGLTVLEALLAEREKTHGRFAEVARLSQGLKSVMASSDRWRRLSPEQKETLEMISLKLARILAGDPNFADHWTDIAGYAQLSIENLGVA